MSVLASAAQQSGGWGHLLGLIVPAVVFFLITSAYKRWQTVKAGGQSPTPPADTPAMEDLQVSEPLTPVDPTSDPVTHDWGAVDYSTSAGREVVAPRDTTPTATRSKATRGDVARWLRGRIGKDGTNQIIRDAEEELGASESTVKRALRDVRGAATSGRDAK